MSTPITVKTAHGDVGAFSGAYAARAEEDALLLPVSRAVPRGDWVTFDVQLADGSTVLEGVGRCMECTDKGSAAPKLERFEVRLEMLQLDGRAEVMFERLLVARTSFAGVEKTGQFDVSLLEATVAAPPAPPPPTAREGAPAAPRKPSDPVRPPPLAKRPSRPPPPSQPKRSSDRPPPPKRSSERPPPPSPPKRSSERPPPPAIKRPSSEAPAAAPRAPVPTPLPPSPSASTAAAPKLPAPKPPAMPKPVAPPPRAARPTASTEPLAESPTTVGGPSLTLARAASTEPLAESPTRVGGPALLLPQRTPAEEPSEDEAPLLGSPTVVGGPAIVLPRAVAASDLTRPVTDPSSDRTRPEIHAPTAAALLLPVPTALAQRATRLHELVLLGEGDGIRGSARWPRDQARVQILLRALRLGLAALEEQVREAEEEEL